jgi:hypothetical protein
MQSDIRAAKPFSWIWASIIQAKVAGTGIVRPASCSPWSVLVPAK